MRNARLDDDIPGSCLTENTPQLSRRPTTEIIAVLRDNRTELIDALYRQSAEQLSVAGGTYRYQYVLEACHGSVLHKALVGVECVTFQGGESKGARSTMRMLRHAVFWHNLQKPQVHAVPRDSTLVVGDVLVAILSAADLIDTERVTCGQCPWQWRSWEGSGKMNILNTKILIFSTKNFTLASRM
jgi:hypothetical protein